MEFQTPKVLIVQTKFTQRIRQEDM